MSYWRTRRSVEQYKKATGQPYKEVPNELVDAEEQHTRMLAELEQLKARGASEEAIAEKRVDIGVLMVRYRRLMQEYASK